MTPYSVQPLSYDESEYDWASVAECFSKVRRSISEEEKRKNGGSKKTCGGCVHWHPWPKERQAKLDEIGDCDKLKKGARAIPFGGQSATFRFSGHTYFWESLNSVFHCYEERPDDDKT